MTTPIAYPLVNGRRHAFNSVELKLAGQVYIGFKSINYTWKLSPTMVYGNHPDPIGQTLGTAEYTCDAELYLAEYHLLIAGLGAGFAVNFFQILTTYTENGFDVYQDTINGVRLVGGDASQSQGPDPLVRKCTFMPTKILVNGLDPLAIPLVGVPQ